MLEFTEHLACVSVLGQIFRNKDLNVSGFGRQSLKMWKEGRAGKEASMMCGIEQVTLGTSESLHRILSLSVPPKGTGQGSSIRHYSHWLRDPRKGCHLPGPCNLCPAPGVSWWELGGDGCCVRSPRATVYCGYLQSGKGDAERCSRVGATVLGSHWAVAAEMGTMDLPGRAESSAMEEQGSEDA